MNKKSPVKQGFFLLKTFWNLLINDFHEEDEENY